MILTIYSYAVQYIKCLKNVHFLHKIVEQMKWLVQCKYTHAEFLNVFNKMNSIKKFNV